MASGKKAPTTEGSTLEEKNQTRQLRNEAQLNCVSLRSEVDYEVTWGTVKGRDERPYGTPLTVPQVTAGGLFIMGK